MYLSVYVGVCTRVLVPMEARDMGYPGAGVTAVVTQLVCVQGTQQTTSSRAVQVLTHWAISPVPNVTVLKTRNKPRSEERKEGCPGCKSRAAH